MSLWSWAACNVDREGKQQDDARLTCPVLYVLLLSSPTTPIWELVLYDRWLMLLSGTATGSKTDTDMKEKCVYVRTWWRGNECTAGPLSFPATMALWPGMSKSPLQGTNGGQLMGIIAFSLWVPHACCRHGCHFAMHWGALMTHLLCQQWLLHAMMTVFFDDLDTVGLCPCQVNERVLIW